MKGDDFFHRVSAQRPFTDLHPKTAAFFKEYLASEKVAVFGDQFVVNTNFPPYPSPAFDNMVSQFDRLGQTHGRRLYSVTLAVTNRCSYDCWHCYNAGRSQDDLSLSTLKRLVGELNALSPVIVTLTGGEPLLRDDLVEIIGLFEPRTCMILGTTGSGLTPVQAQRLKRAGLFAIGISLDSHDPQEHDAKRRVRGAHESAVKAVSVAREAGLYPYLVAVATRELLGPARFWPFLEYAGSCGALEVHLLEPSATGRLTGRSDVLLTASERSEILRYQKEVARREELPLLSTLTYLESIDAFGCGAGLTHLYIDGSGEVCPCNLVPASFGNVANDPLDQILNRMSRHFSRPRPTCVGRILANHIPSDRVPAPPEVSDRLCSKCLPRSHPLPRFFRIQSELRQVGHAELRSAYDTVHEVYDEHWLTQAARPIEELIAKIPWRGNERVFEAGCGTGYATALLSERVKEVVAADLSKGMQSQANSRLVAKGVVNVRFKVGDALQLLNSEESFDTVFSSWVLGYIPLEPFFTTAAARLSPGGILAFVVHRDGSPREAVEIFDELVREDPSILEARVAFDFPRDACHARTLVEASGLAISNLWEGSIVFRCPGPREVLDHLIHSGAGMAFYEAVVPDRRQALTDEFLRRLAKRAGGRRVFEVVHEYVSCVAVKP